MDLLDRRLQRLARARRLQRAYDGVLPTLAVSVAIAATVIIVIRLSAPAVAPLVPAIALGALLTPLVLLPRLMRHRDPPALLAGHLDRLVDADGVAMALAAQPVGERDEDWRERVRRRLEDAPLPRFDGRAGRAPLLAVVGLAGALMLPQAVPTVTVQRSVDRLLAPVSEQLDAMLNAGLVPDEPADDLRRRLDEIRERAGTTGMDQVAWDALARLQQDASAAGGAAARSLAAVWTANEALAAQPDAGMAAAVAAEVANLAQRAPGLVPRLPAGADADRLAAALRLAAERGLLSPEAAQALAAQGLRPAGDRGAGMDADDARALADRLAEELAERAACLGTCGLAEMFEDGCNSGTVARGPGHAELTYGEALRSPGGTSEGLPTGWVLNADGSVTLAEQERAAELDAAAMEAAVRAALRQHDPADADARRVMTAPRHRAAVQRYFAASP